VAAALAWSTGLVLTGFGVSLHELPLLYIGYGILGGIGWGLGYISPVSTLLKWFPDRRGLASGLALTAFGGGAMLATPINESLLNLFFELPQYLGSVDTVSLVTEGGRRFAEVAGEMKEVVVATAADVASLPVAASPGVYVVGTGDTGASSTFFTLSAGYLLSMNIGAFIQRVPREGWLPANWTPPVEAEQQHKMISQGNVHHNEALKTPQFYLLWLAVAGNATAGISVISCAKTMMSDIFATAMPAIVNGAFAASYVAALSAGNMLGRLGWANFSDWAGRKRTYFLFGLAVPTLAALPSITNSVVNSPDWLPLAVFYGSTVFLVSFYGGVFSVLPPYISDLFGGKHVGAIHGRMLTAWSAAAVAGPNILTHMRGNSHTSAIEDLASKVEPTVFEQTFGAPLTDLSALIAAKTVTIPQLMQVVPAGVPDPSPTLYNTTLYSMAALAAVALVSNAAIRPIDRKHFMSDGTSTPIDPTPTQDPTKSA
jgi:MFS family permease